MGKKAFSYRQRWEKYQSLKQGVQDRKILSFSKCYTYPIAEESSSVVPSASNISSSFGLLSPVNIADVPGMQVLGHLKRDLAKF